MTPILKVEDISCEGGNAQITLKFMIAKKANVNESSKYYVSLRE